MKILGGRYRGSSELRDLGLSVGANVLIHETSQIVDLENIIIGDNVRIDPFCILSAAGGRIEIGSHIHLSAHCCLFGGGNIILEDFSGISPGCRLFSASDTFSGEVMIGATIPSKYTKVIRAPIRLKMYAQLGTGTSVLPGVTVAEGAITGAHSLVITDLEPWGVHVGNPAKMIKKRDNALIGLADRYREELRSRT